MPSLFAEALSQESPRASWEFPKIGVPYFGDLIIRILPFRVLYWGPLFSETPTSIPVTAEMALIREKGACNGHSEHSVSAAVRNHTKVTVVHVLVIVVILIVLTVSSSCISNHVAV